MITYLLFVFKIKNLLINGCKKSLKNKMRWEYHSARNVCRGIMVKKRRDWTVWVSVVFSGNWQVWRLKSEVSQVTQQKSWERNQQRQIKEKKEKAHLLFWVCFPPGWVRLVQRTQLCSHPSFSMFIYFFIFFFIYYLRF